MVSTAAASRQRAPRAFSLLEVVATVALVALVATAGVFGFSAVSDRAAIENAKADLDVVRTAQVRYAVTHDRFATVLDALALPEDVTVTAGPSLAPGQISVAVGGDGSLALAAAATDDRCVTLRVAPWGLPAGAVYGELGDGAACDARSALTPGVAPVELT